MAARTGCTGREVRLPLVSVWMLNQDTVSLLHSCPYSAQFLLVASTLVVDNKTSVYILAQTLFTFFVSFKASSISSSNSEAFILSMGESTKTL